MSRVAPKKKKAVQSLILIAVVVMVPVLIASIPIFLTPSADLYLRMYLGETSSFNVTATNLSDKPINTTIIVSGTRMLPFVEQVGSIPLTVILPHQRSNFSVAVRLMPSQLKTSVPWVIVYLYGANESRQLLSPAVISVSPFKIAVAVIANST